MGNNYCNYGIKNNLNFVANFLSVIEIVLGITLLKIIFSLETDKK